MSSKIYYFSGTGNSLAIAKELKNMLDDDSSIIKIFGKKLYITPENVSVTENCVGCGICAKVCPLNNIKIVNKRPQWGQECANCLACFHWCPKKAVKGGTMLQKRDVYHHPEISIEDMDNTSYYKL